MVDVIPYFVLCIFFYISGKIFLDFVSLWIKTIYSCDGNTKGARCSSVVRTSALWCDGWSDRSLMVDTLSYFSFQPVLHDWHNKAVVCDILLWDVAYKRPHAANRKE